MGTRLAECNATRHVTIRCGFGPGLAAARTTSAGRTGRCAATRSPPGRSGESRRMQHEALHQESWARARERACARTCADMYEPNQPVRRRCGRTERSLPRFARWRVDDLQRPWAPLPENPSDETTNQPKRHSSGERHLGGSAFGAPNPPHPLLDCRANARAQGAPASNRCSLNRGFTNRGFRNCGNVPWAHAITFV